MIPHLRVALLLLACSGVVTAQTGNGQAPTPAALEPEASTAAAARTWTFTPPDETEIPDTTFGDMVRYGRDLFLHTDQLRGTLTGNDLKCVNCHLDRGRKPDSAPMWGAWPMYPAYREKTGKVDTMTERIQGCFLYSMNGTPPQAGSRVMAGLLSYFYWMSRATPTGVELEGRGYPELPEAAQVPSYQRGAAVYEDKCAVCHGDDGQGKRAEGRYVFPPLWGPESYNWGAGMHRVNTAAAFIKHNMPLGQGGSLSDQEAWDVARFMNSQERPQDPRFEGDLADTDRTYHDEHCHYGDVVNGIRLGAPDR